MLTHQQITPDFQIGLAPIAPTSPLAGLLALVARRGGANSRPVAARLRKTCDVRSTRWRHGAGSQLRNDFSGLRYNLRAAGGNSNLHGNMRKCRRSIATRCIVGSLHRLVAFSVQALFTDRAFLGLIPAAGRDSNASTFRPLPFSLRTDGFVPFPHVVEREETVGLTISKLLQCASWGLRGPFLGRGHKIANALSNQINQLRGNSLFATNNGVQS